MVREFLVGGTTCTKFTSKLKRKDKGKKKRKGKQKRKRKTEKKIEKKTEKKIEKKTEKGKTEQKKEKRRQNSRSNNIHQIHRSEHHLFQEFMTEHERKKSNLGGFRLHVRSIFLQKIRIMFQIYDF